MPAIRWYALFFLYMFEQSGGYGRDPYPQPEIIATRPVRSITAPLLESRASIPSRTPVPWFPGTLFFRPCDLGGSKSGATVASKALKTRGQPRSRSARSAVASRPMGWRRLDGISPPGPNGSTVRNLMAFISSNACKLMAIKAITSRPRHP